MNCDQVNINNTKFGGSSYFFGVAMAGWNKTTVKLMDTLRVKVSHDQFSKKPSDQH